MKVRDIKVKVKLRLNKADSEDYDNIWTYHLEEAYNKATLDLIRRILKGKSQLQDGDEETSFRIDDLQVLLSSKNLSIRKKKNFYETEKFPQDYLYYKRLSPSASKGNCQDITLRSDLKEEANVDINLSFPSFEFEETFHTIIGNRIHVYYNDFDITSVDLTYYRSPKKVDFSKNDYTIEFKDDFCELVIDEAVKILASDFESINQKQIAQERLENNN